MKTDKIIDFVTYALENSSFDEILEKFDLTPQEVFVILYEAGLIEESTLEQEADTAFEF